jgi:hypothetical protein
VSDIADCDTEVKRRKHNTQNDSVATEAIEATLQGGKGQ